MPPKAQKRSTNRNQTNPKRRRRQETHHPWCHETTHKIFRKLPIGPFGSRNEEIDERACMRTPPPSAHDAPFPPRRSFPSMTRNTPNRNASIQAKVTPSRTRSVRSGRVGSGRAESAQVSSGQETTQAHPCFVATFCVPNHW